MADTTTTNYGLTKPEVGASEDTWGTKINTNLDTLDTTVDSIQGKSGAGVLKHTNNTKLATTSTGIDVTGTASLSSTAPYIDLFETDTTDLNSRIVSNSSSLRLQTIADNGSGASNRLLIDHSTGDISFYEDTGTTPKLFWDASAEALGIGTSSPASLMHLSANAPVLSFTDTNSFTDVNDRFIVRASSDQGNIQWYDDSTSTTSELMTFLSSGNVGIGTSSPSASKFSSTPDGVLNVSGDKPVVYLTEEDETDSNVWMGLSNEVGIIGNTGAALAFRTGASTATERFRISSDGSLSTPTLGTSNVRFGVNAGNSITSGGDKNTLIGDEAGTSITTGDDNTAVGMDSLKSTTTATGNTAVGRGSLWANTTGASNVALGWKALNVNTTGAENVAVGSNALDANTTGGDNVAVGMHALGSNTTSSDNTAVGRSALANNTAANNTAVGRSALALNTTGQYNVAVGKGSISANTTGEKNVAMGTDALTSNTTASNNTAVGNSALAANTTGTQNTAVGASALDANTTGTNNVAIGKSALSLDTLGARSVAVGVGALENQNFTSTTTTGNTAIGFTALQETTTGLNNTGVGYSALEANTTGHSNTAVGKNAMGTSTTATSNSAFGLNAGAGLTTGTFNTLVGRDSGGGITTGHNNLMLGYLAGNYGTSSTTGSGNVLVGPYCATTSVSASKAMGLGYNLDCAAGYTTLGDATSDIRAAHGNVTWATVSDERYKKDIVDSTAGLSFINALQPRTFNYRTLGELPETFSAYEEGSTEVFKSSQTQHGFIAQEIKAAIDADDSIKDGFKLWDDREDGSQEVAEAALIPVLVKAVQELSTQLDAALARIETLEG